MEEKMTKYKYWDILEEMPENWKVDKTASPLFKHVFIINGSCPFTSTKRALIHISNVNKNNNFK